MAFEKVSKALVKIFGSRNERLVKVYDVIAQQAGEFEERTKKLDDENVEYRIESTEYFENTSKIKLCIVRIIK